MILVSRHDKESVTITTPAGEHIEIEVMQCEDGKVRFGVDAPLGCKVERSEAVTKYKSASSNLHLDLTAEVTYPDFSPVTFNKTA